MGTEFVKIILKNGKKITCREDGIAMHLVDQNTCETEKRTLNEYLNDKNIKFIECGEGANYHINISDISYIKSYEKINVSETLEEIFESWKEFYYRCKNFIILHT